MAELDPEMLHAGKLVVEKLKEQLKEIGVGEVSVREFRSGGVAARVQERIRSKDAELVSRNQTERQCV